MQPLQVESFPRWDLRNLPSGDVTFLVKPYIVKDALTLLVGEGGASKSWLALDLALALATGGIWMGSQCATIRVVYFDEDGSEIETARRYRRLCAARELACDDSRLLENFSMIPPQGLHLESPDVIRRVCQTLVTYKSEFAIFDALVAVHGLEESSNNEMKIVMRERIRAMMRLCKVSSLVIHHLAKGGEDVTDLNRVRGASEIVNASDAALLAKWETGGHRLSMIRSKMLPREQWPAGLEYRLLDDDGATFIALSRMTDDQLREAYRSGKTYEQLAKDTGISKSRLFRIVTGKPHG